MRAGADDERREHGESSTLLPANVVLLLDELGHGQLLRRLEDEFASARSFCALAQRLPVAEIIAQKCHIGRQ